MQPGMRQLTFGTELQRQRLLKDQSLTSCCKHFSCSKEEYLSWEADSRIPDATQIVRLFRWAPVLKRYTVQITATRNELKNQSLVTRVERIQTRAAVLSPPKPPQRVMSEQPKPAIPRFSKFGEALQHYMTRSGVSDVEVAELLSVTNGAVYLWRTGRCNPVLSNYKKLKDLFPDLVNAPTPDVRDIDVPVGQSHTIQLRNDVVVDVMDTQVPEDVEPAITKSVPTPQPEQPKNRNTTASLIKEWMALLGNMSEKDRNHLIHVLELAEKHGLELQDLVDILN